VDDRHAQAETTMKMRGERGCLLGGMPVAALSQFSLDLAGSILLERSNAADEDPDLPELLLGDGNDDIDDAATANVGGDGVDAAEGEAEHGGDGQHHVDESERANGGGVEMDAAQVEAVASAKRRRRAERLIS
jgi:hypothetical protein